ncbi:MAG: TenA family protein [Nocardioides sp.]|nr:TenA family protein [Nocardioides sp.]
MSHTLSTDRFTDALWDSTEILRAEIERLEFLEQLGSGTLPLDVFAYYLEQDALYLAGYSKALALLASRAPDPATAAFWASSAHTAAVVETGLHSGILATIEPSGEGGEHSPTCLGYVSYLIATAATAPYPVAAAAILPCFWIYADVGARLAREAADVLSIDPEHPYAQWVATYEDEEFQSSVRTARELIDVAAAGATEGERAEMSHAFGIATRYELLFWDTALNRRPWPALATIEGAS